MSKSTVSRMDYATGFIFLFLLLIFLLPVGGVAILGLLAPIWIAGLIALATISVFRRR